MSPPSSSRTPPVATEMSRPGLACLGIVAMMLVLVASVLYRTGAFDLDLGSLLSNQEPAPLAEPERFVRIELSFADAVITEESVRRWLAGQVSLERVALWRSGIATVGKGGVDPRALPAAEVSSGFFEAVGARPMLGRPLVPVDFEPGQPVVVLSQEIWREWLGSDPTAIGRIVEIGGREHVVVGVMPEGFSFPADAQLWLRLDSDEASQLVSAGQVDVFGKLHEGVGVEQSGAELQRLVPRNLDGATGASASVRVSPLFGE